MKNIPSLPALLLAAAVASGPVASFAAGDEAAAPMTPAPAPTAAGQGLLGQTYVDLGYRYTDFTDSSVNGSTYNFAMNQGVREGLDTLLEYSYFQSDSTGAGHIDQQIFDVGARAFTSYSGVKPYAEAGLGGLWVKTPTLSHQHSFLWFVGAGVELPAGPSLTITPYARLSYANSVTNPKQWDYGVRGNYWLTERVALMGTIGRDNTRDMSYGLGLNIRY